MVSFHFVVAVVNIVIAGHNVYRCHAAWRLVLRDPLPVISLSATPVRRGVAFLMSSGGGALLATGYFLPALQAETQILDVSGPML
jgi:hypothetical protein